MYDSVASDEDYAYAEKGVSPERASFSLSNGLPNENASEDDLKKSLTSSQATINRLQSEIKLLQVTVGSFFRTNTV